MRVKLCGIIALIIAASLYLPGCGGGGSSVAPPALAGGGNGKVAATVMLTGRAGGRMAEQIASATVNITVTISGVYSGDNTVFTPVSTTFPINLEQGYAHMSVTSVPTGVNHLLTAVADWGGATETVKAIIPSVTVDTTTAVTVDATSTVVADTAIYLAAQQGKALYELTADTILEIEQGVEKMAANGIPCYGMTPESVLAYIGNVNVPARITISPASATVVMGENQQFTSQVLDANGFPISTATTTWSFSDPTVGSITSAGMFTGIASGTGIITVSYATLTATAPVSVVKPPPVIASVSGPGTLGLNQPFEISFTPVNGTPPFTWSLDGGAYPAGTTINPDTGVVTGTTPGFISSSLFFVRLTDSLGRATSNDNPNNITDATIYLSVDVSHAIQEIEAVLTAAENGMSNIQNLLQQLRSLALETINNNTNNTAACNSALAAIDNVISGTTSSSSILNNGPVLLDGSYASSPITIDLGGSNTFATNIFNSTRAQLGIAQVGPDNYGTPCAMGFSGVASVALPQIDNAIAMMNTHLNQLGVKSEIGNYLLDSNNTIIQYPATAQCLPDLYSTTGLSDDLLNQMGAALNRIRSIVVQASSGTLTNEELAMLQVEVDGINGYLDILSGISTFNGNLLFNGTFSQSCAGAPTVTNPDTHAATLGVNSVVVTNMSDPQPYLDAIDAALASISAQRTNLQGWKGNIGGLLP